MCVCIYVLLEYKMTYIIYITLPACVFIVKSQSDTTKNKKIMRSEICYYVSSVSPGMSTLLHMENG